MIVFANDRQYAIPPKGQLRFGTSQACEVELEAGPGISAVHAKLRYVGPRLLVEIQDQGTIALNGGNPARLHWVKAGDRFRFSRDGLEFLVSDAATEQEANEVVSTRHPTSIRDHANVLGRIAVAVAIVAAIVIVLNGWLGRPQDPENAVADDTLIASGQAPIQPDAAVPEPVETDTLVTDEQARNGVVLVGFEIDGENYAMCSGWAIDSSTVITSAVAVSALRSNFADDPTSVFVVDAGTPPGLYRVDEMRLHPLWNENEPDGTQSIQNDVGLLKLTRELRTAFADYSEEAPDGVDLLVSSVALQGDIDVIKLDGPLSISIDRGGEFLLEGADFGHAILRVEMTASRGVQGSPVWKSSRVVGTVTRSLNDRIVIVPNDRLAALLE